MKCLQLLFAGAVAVIFLNQPGSYAASVNMSAHISFEDSTSVSVTEDEVVPEPEPVQDIITQNSTEIDYLKHIISNIGVLGSVSQTYQISAQCSLSNSCKLAPINSSNYLGNIETSSGNSDAEVSLLDINGNTGIKQILVMKKSNYSVDVLVVYL